MSPRYEGFRKDERTGRSRLAAATGRRVAAFAEFFMSWEIFMSYTSIGKRMA
jgi:hypothetical protein